MRPRYLAIFHTQRSMAQFHRYHLQQHSQWWRRLEPLLHYTGGIIEKSDKKLNLFGKTGLVISILLATTPVTAQTLQPVDSEVASPVTIQPQTPPFQATGTITRRLRTPISRSQYSNLKLKAANSPEAQSVDQLSGNSLAPAPLTSDITSSFLGLDRPSSANNGATFAPPDPTVAQGPNNVLQATNSAIRLFGNTGSVIATADLNTFFNNAPTANGLLFDPKVYYDRNATNQRFYVTALQSNFNSTSTIWLAISRSNAPANLSSSNWCVYGINGVRNSGTSQASFADYPGIGAGADSLLLTTNQFTFSGDSFTYAIVRAFNKIVASNNAGSCPSIPFSTFQPSNTAGDSTAFTLQPVQHYSSPSSFSGITNPAYLLATIFGSSNQYRVWRVQNVTTSPTITTLPNVTGSFTYNVPPDAPQTGSSLLLDTGDNRIMQAAGVGNEIWGVHSTLCNLGGGANESCVRSVRISVSSSTTPSLSEQRSFGYSGEFFFWPGIAANGLRQIAVPFHYVSSGLTGGYLSSWFAVKDPDAPYQSILPITTGTCPQTTNRTGDYSGANTDPVTFRNFTLTGERATTISSSCQWQTQIIKVDPGIDVIPFTPQEQ